MRHFSKLMLILSSSIISFTSCYESALDKPAEKLSGNKVHAQMYVSLNYDDAVFAGDANVSNRRFIVEARDAENTENVLERKEIVYNTASTVTEGFERIPVVFELDQKKYVVSVWMDYIETGTDKDFYYNTEDLSKISIITPESTADVHRDALASTQTIDLTEQALGAEFAVNAQLVSPVAKVSLIAQDWLNFLQDRKDAAKTAQVTINFASEMPTSYDVLSNTSAVSTIEEKNLPINVPENSETTGKTTITELYFIGAIQSANLSVNILSAEGATLYNDNYTISIETGKNNKIEESFLTGTDTPIKEIIFDGSGTAENPFKIETVDNLYKLMELINTDNNTDYQSAYYQQIDNLDLTGGEALTIGTEEFPFMGTYDGDEKTISNNTGLFGIIENATIKNVRLENSLLNKTSEKGGLICTTSKGNSNIEYCGCTFSNGSDGIQVQRTLGGLCGEVVSGTLKIKGCKISGTKLKVLSKEGGSCNGGFIGIVNNECNANITDSYITLSLNLTQAGGSDNTNGPIGDCLGGFCGKNDGVLSVTRSYINTKLQGGKGASTYGGIIVGSGTATIVDCFSVLTGDNFLTGNNIKEWISNNESNITQFADKAWPNWDINGSTAWGNMGEYNADGSTYPTLKWEN